MARSKRILGATLVHASPGRFMHEMSCVLALETPQAEPGAETEEYCELKTAELLAATVLLGWTAATNVRDTWRTTAADTRLLLFI